MKANAKIFPQEEYEFADICYSQWVNVDPNQDTAL